MTLRFVGFSVHRKINVQINRILLFRLQTLVQCREALQQRRQEAVATAAIEALTKDSILHRRDVRTLVKAHKDKVQTNKTNEKEAEPAKSGGPNNANMLRVESLPAKLAAIVKK